jgi:UDP-N-acetylglucosamine--N-acetylmuramyl-(pentapeptide) pyrophosphoryl-undecaprenol N-acetylglucosamine transferase
MKNRVSRVALAAGGTGGHFFPAQALAEAMLARDMKPLLVCDQRTKEFINGGLAKIESIKIFAPKPGSAIFSKTVNFLKLVPIIWKVKKALQSEGVEAVVGFGGYPSFPTMMAALLLRLPIYIHEQNAVMGRVNRLFARFACRIFISFEKTLKVPSSAKKRLVFSGNLVRDSVAKFASTTATNTPSKHLKLVVLGGSQGSQLLTEVAPKIVTLLDESIQKRLITYQQTRYGLIDGAKAAYKKTKCHKVIVEPFFENVGELLHDADLVICRAGASTVTEVAMIGTPAIFVPLKIARDNHQYHNAKFLVDMGGAYMFTEDNFTPKIVAELVYKILEDSDMRKSMKDALKNNFKPSCTQEMLKIIEKSY